MFPGGPRMIRSSAACAANWRRTGGAIEHLPERERLVMTLYYYEEMTMREIGLALGVVESRVSQIHASAVVHLRAALQDLAAGERARRARGACCLNEHRTTSYGRPCGESEA